MRTVLLIVLLAGCGDNIDENGESHGLADLLTEWLTSTGAEHGSVYICDSPAVCLEEDGVTEATEEWCWDGEEEDLEALVGGRCRPIEFDDREWPWLVGCAYKCEDPKHVGCNAHCGCKC